MKYVFLKNLDNLNFVRKYIILILVCAFSLVKAKDDPKQAKRVFKLAKGVTTKDYISGKLIIKFKIASSANVKSTGTTPSISKLKFKSGTLLNLTPVFNNPGRSESSISKLKTDTNGLDRIYHVKFTSKLNIEAAINQLLENNDIEYAEPDYIYHTTYVPSDPSLPLQYQLPQIKAPAAWDIIKNSSNITIAIIDAGSDLEHEDLAANIAINTNDPINGIDDDGDGYIDNNRGWDFVGASSTNSKQDNDPDVKNDANYHGIHVSGIASAVTDNGKGVASAAFNAKLLILKAGADDDAESIYNGYQAIKYAADHHAQVINCSWGGPGGGSFGQDVINYATSRNSLVIAAAGNDGTNSLDYPASFANVLSVASVNSDDRRSSFSNFGFLVDISAPGANIYSTFNNNKYGNLSGTSMSTPLVSSAAALVKARFPELDMQQVGEQLTSSTDNVDGKNPSYIGQLGKGRLNLLKAVTQISTSVKNQKLTIDDSGSGTIPAGDTINLYFDLKNFLSPVNGLNVTISSTNSHVEILKNAVMVGAIGTNQLKTMVGPFSVYIKPSTPDNEKVDFRINYSANGGAYQDYEMFRITAAVDYLNYHVNDVASTITSIGRVGYSDEDQLSGQGFNYKGNQLLFEGSLMVGYSKTRISDNTRNENGGSNNDFVKKIRVAQVKTSKATFDAKAEFDDSGNTTPLKVSIKNRHVAYSKSSRSKFTIVEYDIQNAGTATVEGLYAGLFTDWDVDEGGKDVTKFDLATRMGYTFGKGVGTKYAGVKLLSRTGGVGYYPMSAEIAGDPLETGGGLTKEEKYTTLSSGVKALSLGEDKPNGYDVMFVTSSGPYKLAPNASAHLAFAIIGGDNLTDLKVSADTAQIVYDKELSTEPKSPISTEVILNQNYPNPTAGETTITFNIPSDGRVLLELYNLLGQRVATLINEDLPAGYYPYTLKVNELDLQSGMYIYRLKFQNTIKSNKIEVFRP